MKAQARMEMYTYAEKVRAIRDAIFYIIFLPLSRFIISFFYGVIRAGANFGTGSGRQVPTVESIDRGMAIDGERA